MPKTTPRTVFSGWSGCWREISVLTIYILEEEFVEKALDSKSAIGRAVREMKLEVVALGQSLPWKWLSSGVDSVNGKKGAGILAN